MKPGLEGLSLGCAGAENPQAEAVSARRRVADTHGTRLVPENTHERMCDRGRAAAALARNRRVCAECHRPRANKAVQPRAPEEARRAKDVQFSQTARLLRKALSGLGGLGEGGEQDRRNRRYHNQRAKPRHGSTVDDRSDRAFPTVHRS